MTVKSETQLDIRRCAMTPNEWIRASDYLHEMVYDHAGNALGEIKDLILDTEHGCVAYAILTFGSVLGLGRRLFPVPWRAFKFSSDHSMLLLNITRARLEQAPGFDGEVSADLLDRNWGRRIHEHYESTPYWEN